GLAQRVVFFRSRQSGAGDGTPGEHNIVIVVKVPQPVTSIGDQRIFAAAGRPSHGHEHTLLYGVARFIRRAFDRIGAHQATRRPSRQPVRTTGMSPSSRTRTRSARRPGSITPRSVRPTASAGFFDTFATACGSEIPSTTSPRKKVACRRLKGM